MNEIWILWWKYSDGSGEEIVRAYHDESRAKQDFELVENDTIKEWKLIQVPCVAFYNPNTLRG